MDAELKATCPPTTVVILGLLSLMGVVEDRLSTWGRGIRFTLGIVLFGFADVLLWPYVQREAPPEQPHQMPGKQQIVGLIVDPQLGMFQFEQDPAHPVYVPG